MNALEAQVSLREKFFHNTPGVVSNQSRAKTERMFPGIPSKTTSPARLVHSR